MEHIFSTMVLLHAMASFAFADIAPNPIKANGIIACQNTTIRMESERVTVNLYKDSSSVECHFNMKNYGDAQNLQIGFPDMNFQYFSLRNENNSSKIFVMENGLEVNKIDLHKPFNDGNNSKTAPIENVQNQPWFIWNSTFGKQESKTIVVRYSLPYGATKIGHRYFTYLLNTGAGWKGTIGKADVVINLKDIDPDLILKISPEAYCFEENTITWTFTDLEPTSDDDIKVYYEPSKGYLKQKQKENPPTIIVIDNQIMPQQTLFDIDSFVKSADIESIEVLKDKESTSKYTSDNNGVILIITKDFAKKKENP